MVGPSNFLDLLSRANLAEVATIVAKIHLESYLSALRARSGARHLNWSSCSLFIAIFANALFCFITMGVLVLSSLLALCSLSGGLQILSLLVALSLIAVPSHAPHDACFPGHNDIHVSRNLDYGAYFRFILAPSRFPWCDYAGMPEAETTYPMDQSYALDYSAIAAATPSNETSHKSEAIFQGQHIFTNAQVTASDSGRCRRLDDQETSAIAKTHEPATIGAVTDATVEVANDESAVVPSVEQGDAAQGDALSENVPILDAPPS